MPLTFIKNKKRIYLDHASSAPVLPQVLSAAKSAQQKFFGNPSSIHKDGVFAKRALEEARVFIAKHFDAHPNEMIFTSGGTESNAIALLGVYWSAIQNENFFTKKTHIITTVIEHPSVLKTCKMLEREGVRVTYLPVDENGLVDVKSLGEAICDETILVTVAYANNEIGVIQPIKEIAKEIRRYKKNNKPIDSYPLLHTDACQAIQYLDIGVERLGVDLLSWNGSKIGAGRGVGALYIKRGSPISSIYSGGGQEYGIRSGTENVSGVVGLSIALSVVREKIQKENDRLCALRDFCFLDLAQKFPEIRINGSVSDRLSNNINISFKKFTSELLVLELDAKGISVSAGSACDSTKDAGSHVLNAMYGNDDEKTWGSIRISLGQSTKKKDIDFFISSLHSIFEKYKKTGII